MFGQKTIVCIFFIVLILHAIRLFPQHADTTPQKVVRYCYVVKSKEWYQNQERLWKQELSKNPLNEDAWYNYFFAARYGWTDVKGRTLTRETLMDSIYQEMGKAIPDSWVYHYIHYYNYATDFSRLEKAYEINPHIPDLYWEFIKEYALTRQDEKKRTFCMKLYESRDISTGIYNLNYNMLNSASRNAILFTNGDTDTYPAWVLQEAKGIRTDVLILTMHGTFFNRDYLKSLLADRGIHLDVDSLSKSDVAQYFQGLVNLLQAHYPDVLIHAALSVYAPYYESFKDKMHLTGFVLTYSEDPLDSDERHREIIENDLRLDYLEHDWYADLHVSEPFVRQLNVNYVVPFIKLAEYYHSKGDADSAREWKNKALSLAQKADDDDWIQRIKAMTW